MALAQRKLPALPEQHQIDSINRRLGATRELISAYPEKERAHYAGILGDMTSNLTLITHGLRALPENADRSTLDAELSTLVRKLNEFQYRLQELHPPSISFATRLQPLTEEPSSPEAQHPIIAAALEILNGNTTCPTDLAELRQHYDSLLDSFTYAVNTHFKEGWMAYILNYAAAGLLQKGFQFGLTSAKREGAAQKIILWHQDENGFQEQVVGELLQPTEEKPEHKFFSLTLHSAQLTDDPLGWLEGYCKLQGFSLRSLSEELEQQAISKGMQGFSATFGREGLIMCLEVTFTDSSKINLRRAE